MHQMSKVVIEIVHFYFSFALTSVLHFVLFICKVVSFGTGTYGYKDGSGNALNQCPDLDRFNADFRSMEMCFRRADNADLLAKAANHVGSANLRCRSQFNVTRCAGEMHQHTWALRMSKVPFLTK